MMGTFTLDQRSILKYHIQLLEATESETYELWIFTQTQ